MKTTHKTVPLHIEKAPAICHAGLDPASSAKPLGIHRNRNNTIVTVVSKYLKKPFLILIAAISVTASADVTFRGSADASAAAALDNTRFIIADDEDNTLRIYDSNRPDTEPVQEIDLSPKLSVDEDYPETDIEGAAQLNKRIFWITSHGRNKKGKYRQSRYRFFATSFTNGKLSVDGVYSNLANDLIAYDKTYKLGLEKAIGTKNNRVSPAKIPDCAPKIAGLNIEGLSTAADGKTLLIGFRNPRPRVNNKEMALIIPLTNPEDVLLKNAKPILQSPILLDLNGLGIRGMEYSSKLQKHLIIAGSHKGSSSAPASALYTCDLKTRQTLKITEFTDFNPEAIFQFPNQENIILLSDDGTKLIDTNNGAIENKQLPRNQRTFRTKIITP